MSLDQNLFTLNITQDQKNPHIINLVDPSGTSHYTKQRVAGNEYKIEIYDPLTQSLLITASGPTATSKAKTLELHNPSVVVELKYTGTLSFRWSFKWEEHEFEWKREECFMLRKPDPPVLVAITREPAGRIKTTAVQILDYNLNRFDIDDRKGLEIVILTALLTFQDYNDSTRAPPSTGATPSLSRNTSTPGGAPPPPMPPKPAPKTGVERIAEMQAMRGEINEVTVEDEIGANDYAEYCAKLLEDDAMLFITVKSATAEQVPKVLHVVEETKRIRHKAGLSDDTELHQYVLYDNDKPKGPKRINLDGNDKPKSKYTPPDSLTIHLSKIDMPELRPKAAAKEKEKDKPGKDSNKREEKRPAKPPTPPIASRPPQGPTSKLHKHSSSHALNTGAPHSQPSGPGPSYGPPMAFPAPQIPQFARPNNGTGSLNARPGAPPPPKITAPRPQASNHSPASSSSPNSGPPSTPPPPQQSNSTTKKPRIFESFRRRGS